MIQENEHIYWIATATGLRKFNSLSNEVAHFNRLNSNFPTNYIIDLAIDSQGNLWLATNLGLIRFNESSSQIYNVDNSDIPSDNLYTVSVDADDNVWVGTLGYGFFILSDGVFEHYNSDNTGYSINLISDIAFDSQGIAWMATASEIGGSSSSGGVIKFDGDQFTAFNTSNSDIPDNGIRSVAIDQNDIVYASSSDDVGKLDGDTWYTLNSLPSSVYDGIRHIDIDESGNLWAANYGHGLLQYIDDDWITSISENGGSNYLRKVFIDNNNDVYTCGYSSGLRKFSNFEWDKINIANSPLVADAVHDITIQNGDTKWFANSDKIIRLQNDIWDVYNPQLYTSENGYPILISIDEENNVWVVFRTYNNRHFTLKHENELWSYAEIPPPTSSGAEFVGFSYSSSNKPIFAMGEEIYEFDGTAWINSEIEQNIELNYLNSLARDSEGNLWMLDLYALYKVNDTGVEEFSWSSLGISGLVNSLTIDLEDNIWLSVSGGEILFFDGSNFYLDHTFTFVPSPGASIFDPATYVDRDNNYWVADPAIGEGAFKRIGENNWENLNVTNANILSGEIADIEQTESGEFWFSHGYLGITRYKDIDTSIPNAGIRSVSNTTKIIQTAPNPFSNQVTVNYETFKNTRLTFKVYNQLGVLIKTIFTDKWHSVGKYNYAFKPDVNLSTGVYYLVITSDEETNTQKVFFIDK